MATAPHATYSPVMASVPSVVIPCHNEAEALPGVLDDLARAFGPGAVDIVVVDDGSTDATAAVARAHASNPRIVRHAAARGYGEAIKSGVTAAGGDVVCIIDGDGQHAASDAKRLLEAHLPRTLVVGRRDHPGVGSRRAARSLLRWWSRTVGGVDIHDVNSGMMAFDRALATRMLPFLPEGMAYSDSFKLLYHLLGLALVEVEISVRPRAGGTSKNTAYHGLRTVLSAVVMVVLINPTRVFLPIGLGLVVAGVGWAIPFLAMGRGLTAAAVAMILGGMLCLFFGLVFRVLAGITQSIILGAMR